MNFQHFDGFPLDQVRWLLRITADLAEREITLLSIAKFRSRLVYGERELTFELFYPLNSIHHYQRTHSVYTSTLLLLWSVSTGAKPMSYQRFLDAAVHEARL